MSEKNELQRLWVGVGDQTGFKLNELKEKLASIDGLLSYKRTNTNEFSMDSISEADINLIDNKIKCISVLLAALIEDYTNLAKTTYCNLSTIDNKCNIINKAMDNILHDIENNMWRKTIVKLAEYLHTNWNNKELEEDGRIINHIEHLKGVLMTIFNQAKDGKKQISYYTKNKPLFGEHNKEAMVVLKEMGFDIEEKENDTDIENNATYFTTIISW